MRGLLEGQLAGQPLISNEQFAAGGAESVRGYYESQQLGDDGVSATLELYTPSLAGHLHERIDNLRLLAFADAAYLRNHDTLPGSPTSFELYGAGVGLRLSAFRSLSLNLDLAWPLTDSDEIERGDSRTHFSLNYGF
ncbi:BamA/TamA family outer membrane protein [Thiohalobacter thiocyanaticus]|uniref:BamA/TamA family outer membrane protein n=1 Tax=Thiohalobacter thiocyanaticus TaxID=585455 RepID=UPI00210089AF|nr:BamA/TamA family outer membrane protein [Thiohalobacter thiocyanaticus]